MYEGKFPLGTECCESGEEMLISFNCIFDSSPFLHGIYTGKVPTGRQILEEALEKGYILCSIIKVLTLGAAGSGKTHTKFRLLRENPPKTRCSTPLAEAAIRAISRVLIGTDLTGWFRVSYEELMSMLAKALRAGVPMEATEQYEALRAGVQQLRETLQRSQRASSEPSLSPSSEELVRLVERSSGSKRFFEIQWINFIDSGGQPQFHELLPTFIRNATVIMFVLKLSECLDEQPMIEYYEKGQRCGDAQHSILRNDQILQHCIRTMQSRPSPSSEGRPCKVMMVGTHRDLESQCTETRAEKNEKILQMFEPGFCDDLVFYRPFKEVIFPLNAKEPTKEDREVVSMICEQICDKKFAPKPSKIPIGWFLLEQDIRRLAAELGRGVISMEECLHIATRLKINNEALKAALNYLDELNILLYYPSLLPNVLFAEPQALVDKSSELVGFNYKLRCEQISEPFTGEWKRFRDEGVVTLRMLEDKRFSCHYTPNLFTPTDLIKLFRGLLIFAPLTTEEYFMPSLLPMIPAEEVKQYRPPPSSSTAPLLVHFPHKCAPNGIFCALVVHLLSVCGWELLYQTGSSPACVFRNCIRFKLPGKPATVSLIDCFSFFEVHVKTPIPRILCQIRESVFAGLENASHTLKYDDLKPVVAFFCECGAPPHSATTYIDDKDRYLVCTQTPEYAPLCRVHDVWLREVSPCTPSIDRPSLREMILFPGKEKSFSIPQRVSTKFMQFGILLLDDDMGQRVAAIAHKHRNDCEQINLEILKVWLNGTGRHPVSWRTLISVLHDIHYETLAKDIAAVKC